MTSLIGTQVKFLQSGVSVAVELKGPKVHDCLDEWVGGKRIHTLART